MDLRSILAKLGLGNSGWAEGVETEGVRPDYGLSTATGITRARPEAAGGFEPGEATVEDVRDSLGEVFLAGLGMVPGGVLASSVPTAAGSRTRRLGPDVQTRNRTIRDAERDARPAGYPRSTRARASNPSEPIFGMKSDMTLDANGNLVPLWREVNGVLVRRGEE